MMSHKEGFCLNLFCHTPVPYRPIPFALLSQKTYPLPTHCVTSLRNVPLVFIQFLPELNLSINHHRVHGSIRCQRRLHPQLQTHLHPQLETAATKTPKLVQARAQTQTPTPARNWLHQNSEPDLVSMFEPQQQHFTTRSRKGSGSKHRTRLNHSKKQLQFKNEPNDFSHS